jgi:hypothetical protein
VWPGNAGSPSIRIRLASRSSLAGSGRLRGPYEVRTDVTLFGGLRWRLLVVGVGVGVVSRPSCWAGARSAAMVMGYSAPVRDAYPGKARGR